jgi:uncharacterized protein (DUF433 family)
MISGNLVTCDPEVLGGIPVFNGTRVPVQTFLDYVGDGETLDTFLDDFPSFERRQVEELIAWPKTVGLTIR